MRGLLKLRMSQETEAQEDFRQFLLLKPSAKMELSSLLQAGHPPLVSSVTSNAIRPPAADHLPRTRLHEGLAKAGIQTVLGKADRYRESCLDSRSSYAWPE